MDLTRSRLVLRARDPLGSLDAAVALARLIGRPWLAMAALSVLPWAVFLGAWVAWTPTSPWPWVVALVAAPFVQAPMLRLGAVALFGEVDSVWRLWWSSLQADVLGVILVRGMLWSLLTVMCLGLPTILIVPWSWWLPETYALERRGVGPGLQRAGRLASTALGHVVIGAMLSAGLPLLAVAAAESTLSALLGTVLQLGAPFGSLWDGQGTPWAMAGLLASWALIAWARLVLYLDARTRTEGWDLQLALDGIARDRVAA